jgi:hypothetical protein
VERGGDVFECLGSLGVGELEASVADVIIIVIFGGGSSGRSTISSSVCEFILEVMNMRCGGRGSGLRSLLVPITIITIVVVIDSAIAMISIIVVISTTSVTSTRVTDDRVQLLSIRNLTLRMSRARPTWRRCRDVRERDGTG